MSVLVEKLKNFDYYLKKIPLYLQSDENFVSHFRIWYDFLVGKENETNNGLIGSGDTLLDLFNIYDENYLEKINKYGKDFLDKLANLFNVKRNFSVKYIENNVEKSKQLSLNDEDLLLFIKARIIRNYSNGSYEQMRKFYESNGLNIFLKSNDSASVRAYLLEMPNSTVEYSENIKTLFLSGLLTIESMGVSYSYSMQPYDKFLIWDKPIDSNYTGWDNGEWVI